MRQEAVRKLRHRIAAGLLCWSIIIAGQPNRTGLSMLQAAETESQTEENLNLWTEEDGGFPISTEVDSAEMPNGAEVNESVIPEDGIGMSGVQGTTEPIPEEGQTEAIPEEASANSTGADAGPEMESGSVMAKAVLSAEPQSGDTHQHSVSAACSITTGEQVTFTELNQNFTGDTLADGNYYLSEDIALDHTLKITSGTVHLCLNGHTLRYAGSDKARVVEVSDAVLNVCDCRKDGCISEGSDGGIELNTAKFCLYGGSITNNTCFSTDHNDTNHIGGGINMKDSTLTIYGGSISNNGADSGGGVYAFNSDIILRDGAIEGNRAYDITNRTSTGGGIELAAGSTFAMYGGRISNNTSERWGAAISAPSSVRSSLSIYGGEISGNLSKNGGIVVVSGHDFKMTGGRIINNQFYGDVNNDGALEFTSASVELSGNPVIRNNFLGDHVECNLNLVSNSTITVTDAFTAGAYIGITYQSGIVITSSPFAVPVKGGKEIDIRQYAPYFSSDAEGYGILYQDGRTAGKPEGLYLSKGINIIYDYATNGGDSVSQTSAFAQSFQSLDLSIDAEHAVVAVKSGWEFLGWNTDPDATQALESITTGREQLTLYAIYRKTITASFYSGSEKQRMDKTITIYNNETEGIVKAPPLETMPDWQAVGWAVSTTDFRGGISAETNIFLSEDCDYYGIYEQPITISYDANGGSPAPEAESRNRYANVHDTITYQNPTVNLPLAVTKSGYAFVGWRQGSSGTVKHPEDAVELTGNTVFYADWMAETERSYVVEHYWQNVTGNGYSRIDAIPYTGTAGTTAEAEVRTYTGFTENAEHVSRIPSGVIAEDGSLVLRLYYDRNTYTICFDLNGADGTAPAAQTVRYGGCAGPVLDPVRDGYTFTGWYMEQAGTYSLWNFADTVEHNIQNSQNGSSVQSRRTENTTVILYAGWNQNQSDNNQSDDNTTEETTDMNTSESDTASDTTEPATEGKTSPGNASKKTVPGTGDAAPVRLYVTAAMVAGLSYLMLELADKAELTEEKKRILTARLIQWAKKGGIFRRLAATLIIFLFLIYYHTIGRQMMFQHSFSEKH